MSLKFRYAVLLCGSAALFGLCAPKAAQAQTAGTPPSETNALPEIVVSAPTPIVRRRPRVAAPADTTSPTTTPVTAAVPDQGTLPIVTDQFATVTVIPSDEIRRSAASTLGDLLNNKPGITGSSFAPGASSRPIIRGLDSNRVGLVENGVAANGASDLGEDHFVPIDPLSTNQVEVIRGPATLRYGSQSIGGVVSATNNRIPDTLTCGRFDAGTNPCTAFETRSSLSSVDQGTEAHRYER